MKNRINQIRQKFQKNMDSYNEHAIVQKRIASRLNGLIKQHYFSEPRTILEIGCGTGFLTEKINSAYPTSHYYLNDLNEAASLVLKDVIKDQPHSFLMGDAQSISLPSDIDLIISSSTIQWFENIPKFLSDIDKKLSQNGYLFFSSFASKNLYEITSLTSKGLIYFEYKELRKLLSRNFDLIHSSEEIMTLEFQSPLEILKHLKQTGVTGSFSSPWTKKTLADFCQNYSEKFCRNGSYPLTYHPVYFGMKKQ